MFGTEPFGQRAVRLGLVTSEQVRLALETQGMLASKSGLIGEIFVEMGWLDPQDYMKLVQQVTADAANQGKGHKELQEEFIRRALEGEFVDEDAVDQARRIQAGFTLKNRLIGQIMVEMGFISPEECKQVLETYTQNARST